MEPSLIVVLAIAFALLVRIFWRALAEIAVIVVVAAVFVGIMTLANASHNVFGG